jgi:hypothetical protein
MTFETAPFANREGHIFMKRVDVIMPYVIQLSSDLLNVHYGRCLETLVRQRELWEFGNSKIGTLARSVRELLPATSTLTVQFI